MSIVFPAMAFAVASHADSIRVDDVWYKDVYVVESAQFYHILNPADGTTIEVSKKRQDISEPRLTKDRAERDELKAKWEVAAQEKEKADARDIELRVREGRLSNRDPNAPKPERRKLSPAEQAARQAAWQQKLLERAQAMEVRQQILNERAGILPEEEPLPEDAPVNEEAPMPEDATATEEGQPVPPGPREQPEQRPMTEEERAAAEQEAMQQEMERLQMEPYFYNEQDRILWEQQQQAEYERLQAEAYFWEQMQSQGYMNSVPYLATPLNSHMAPRP